MCNDVWDQFNRIRVLKGTVCVECQFFDGSGIYDSGQALRAEAKCRSPRALNSLHSSLFNPVTGHWDYELCREVLDHELTCNSSITGCPWFTVRLSFWQLFWRWLK